MTKFVVHDLENSDEEFFSKMLTVDGKREEGECEELGECKVVVSDDDPQIVSIFTSGVFIGMDKDGVTLLIDVLAKARVALMDIKRAPCKHCGSRKRRLCANAQVKAFYRCGSCNQRLHI